MKYRIIIEIEKSGNKVYYAQKRYYKIFWENIMTKTKMYNKIYKIEWSRIGWISLEDAEQYIEKYIHNEHTKKQSKVVKKEYVYINK